MSWQNGEKFKGDRWPSGPQISLGTLIPAGIFFVIIFALLVGASVAMESYFVLSLLIGASVIVVVTRLIRGKSLVPLIAGNDYRDNYIIEGGLVSVEMDGESWVEPLTEYEGVLWHEETVSRHRAGGKSRRDSTFQIIELRHGKDRDRNVNIYTSLEAKGMRPRWEAAAGAFNLPALRDTGDGKILRRESGDLNKTLRQLAHEGRLDRILDVGPQGENDDVPDMRQQHELGPQTMRARRADATNAFSPKFANEVDPSTHPRPASVSGPHRWDQHFKSGTPVPNGARWQCIGDVLDIRLRKAVFPYLLAGFPAAFFAAVVGYMVPADPFNTVTVIGSLALLYWLWVSISFRILVTPQYVKVSRWLGPIPLSRKTVPLDEIEEVLVGQAFLSSAAVLMESDSTLMQISPLSDKSADWLSWFLRAAILTAPDNSIQTDERPESAIQ